MTPGLLADTRCPVVGFVKVGNKEKEPCLVGRKKIKVSSEHTRLRCQSVYETFKWSCHTAVVYIIYLERGREVGLEM